LCSAPIEFVVTSSQWFDEALTNRAATDDPAPSNRPPHGDQPPVADRERLPEAALNVVGIPLAGGVLDPPGHDLLSHIQPRRRMLRSVLEGAQARGELAADADLDSAVNALVGSFYASYLAGTAVPRDWPQRAVELVFDGL
jgi:hypothetical protein